MSIKMQVRYGEKQGPISEVTVTDTQVWFFVMDEANELARLRFDLDDIPEENQVRANLYGLNKLLTDRTSDQKDKEVKLEEMASVFAMLSHGEWAKERVVGAPVVSAEVEALAEMQNISVPEAQQALAAYDKVQRKQILANPKIIELAFKVRERRAAAAVTSLDDLLS